jgi:protein-tyrosine phosphatase
LKQNYLFVCTGNTCRSPLAEVLAASLLEGSLCGSAGLAAVGGQSASWEAILVAEENGLDLSEHRARPLSRELLLWADTVLTMTRSQKSSLLRDYPDHAAKIQTLGEAAGSRLEISDPWGGNLADYKACFAEIRQLLAAIKKQREGV